MACPMDSIKKGNTNLSTETKSGLTNRITRTKIGTRRKRRIIRANTGIRTRIGIDIVPVLPRTKRNMTAAVRIKTRIERALLIRTRTGRRNIRVVVAAVCPTKTKTRAKNIITNRVQAQRAKTGKMKE